MRGSQPNIRPIYFEVTFKGPRHQSKAALSAGRVVFRGSGQVLGTCMERKMLLPHTNLPVMDEIAGVSMASLGVCFHSMKTMGRRVPR